MDKRQLVLDAINHRQPKEVPIDFGSTNISGIHCSVVEKLREHFGLEKRPVKVYEPYLSLGLVEQDLADAMGTAVAMTLPLSASFGFPPKDWKEWTAPWGQTVLVPGGMNTTVDGNGDILAYPMGDVTAPPSGKMPKSGWYFDSITRQDEIDEDNLNPEDNLEEFQIISDEAVTRLIDNGKAAKATGRAVIFSGPNTALGDIGRVPGFALRHPKGIRAVDEWYISVVARADYIREVFRRQTERALVNLEKVRKAGGDDIFDIVNLCGTDFGTQQSTFCSLESFNDVYRDCYVRMCDWVHKNTRWKIFKHSCGAIEPFIQTFIDIGFDILNPVQCSAAGMGAEGLKKKYGDRLVFWGGGVDTQKTLPFGTPEAVRKEVLERCRIFSPGGGFVFNAIHCVQALTPIPNFIAMLDAVKEFNRAGR